MRDKADRPVETSAQSRKQVKREVTITQDRIKQFLTPTEVAELMMVSPVTVRQWAQKGLLPARTTAGGHRRFYRQDIEVFAKERGIDLAESSSGLNLNRLLIVDDDRTLNGFLCALFETELPDVEVFSAFDGFEAGRKVSALKPGVVLLDIMMPGVDGVQVCKSLKSDPATEAIRVVAMTGHHSAELEAQILNSGAEVLLIKPFDSATVIRECGFERREAVTP